MLRMAREADPGFDGGPDADGTMLDSIVGIAAVERFATLVAAAEREAILQMSADNWYKTQKDYDSAIRARGETK